MNIPFIGTIGGAGFAVLLIIIIIIVVIVKRKNREGYSPLNN